jgi:hypothetical protein
MLPHIFMAVAASLVITPGEVPVVADTHPDETAWVQEIKDSRPEPERIILAAAYAPRIPHPLAPAYVEALIEANFLEADHEWARRVTFCESGWDATIKNRRSSAIGLWQFIRSTWDWVSGELGFPNYDEGGPLNPELATQAAAWLYYGYGPQHWECK